MSVSAHQAAPIARLTPICIGLALAHLVGLGITLGIARVAGWNADTGFGPLGSGLLGTSAVAAGSVCGILILRSPSSRSLRRIGPSVMAASVARMLVALFCIVLFFFATQSQPQPLFVALLACGILTLITETVWSITAVRRATATAPSPLSPRDSHGARSA